MAVRPPSSLPLVTSWPTIRGSSSSPMTFTSLASMGIEAIAQYAKDGTLPAPTEGKEFTDTGVTLITDKPVDGLESITTAEGLEKCWG